MGPDLLAEESKPGNGAGCRRVSVAAETHRAQPEHGVPAGISQQTARGEYAPVARFAPPHLAHENAVRVEKLVAAVSTVVHNRGAVAEDREPRRHVELAGPFARGAEFAQEVTGRVKDQDALAPRGRHHDWRAAPEGHTTATDAVDDVKVPLLVERDVPDAAEHLPVLAVQYADSEDFLEVGVQALVAAGEVDDFLGREGLGGGEGGGEQGDAGGDKGPGGHDVFSCNCEVSWLVPMELDEFGQWFRCPGNPGSQSSG